MKDFLISTDTTADLPASYVKENNIDIHTLFYAFGEVIYGTDNIMPEKEFFDRMRNGDMPTTMACNPQDLRQYLKSVSMRALIFFTLHFHLHFQAVTITPA